MIRILVYGVLGTLIGALLGFSYALFFWHEFLPSIIITAFVGLMCGLWYAWYRNRIEIPGTPFASPTDLETIVFLVDLDLGSWGVSDAFRKSLSNRIRKYFSGR